MAWRMGAFRVALSVRDRRLVLVRALADTASTWFFLQALYHMPIANLTAIMQALPLTVTLGAALFLAEPVGWRRLLAIGVGFAGVLMIAQPGPSGFGLHAVYALICVFLVTARDLLTRGMSRSVPSLVVALANAVLVTLFGLAGSLSEPLTLPDLPRLGLILGTALCIVAGYLLTVMAVRTGELAVVTPYRYTALVWALVLGFLVFGEWPDWVTATGAGLIVGSGLFTLYRQRVAARKARAPARR
jgi:S-adenosylmethionine uptake transporter